MTHSRLSMGRAFPILIAAAVMMGCGESPTAPSAYSRFRQQDLRLGTGAAAASGLSVAVNYTLWLYDSSKPDGKGAQLESTAGGTPFGFTLGAGQTIAGWEQGVVGMLEGGVRRLVVPPSLAYGPDRNGVVPPNATLVFDIELLDVLDQ